MSASCPLAEAPHPVLIRYSIYYRFEKNNSLFYSLLKHLARMKMYMSSYVCFQSQYEHGRQKNAWFPFYTLFIFNPIFLRRREAELFALIWRMPNLYHCRKISQNHQADHHRSCSRSAAQDIVASSYSTNRTLSDCVAFCL